MTTPQRLIRRRSLTGARFAVLAGGFLVNVGSFSVHPYIAVLLHQRVGLAMGQVGMVLAVATLVQFGSAPATAAVAERIGLKRSLLAALVLYSLGGAAFLAASAYPVLVIAGLLLISGGGSLYGPAYRAYLVQGAGDEERPWLVSAGSAAGNLGVAFGPLVGALLIQRPEEMFAVVTAIYLAMAAGHVFVRREPPVEDAPVVEPFRRMVHGIAMLPFVVSSLSLYVYMQFYQYLSSYAQGRISTLTFGLAMMGYSLGLAVLQPLVSGWVQRMSYRTAMLIGFGGLAAGMVAFSAVLIMPGVAAISFGNAVLFLKNDLEALARSKRSATVVFGQQRLAAGVGACLSGLIGGTLYGVFERAGHLPWFWLAVAAQCVLIPLVVLATRRAA